MWPPLRKAMHVNVTLRPGPRCPLCVIYGHLVEVMSALPPKAGTHSEIGTSARTKADDLHQVLVDLAPTVSVDRFVAKSGYKFVLSARYSPGLNLQLAPQAR